MYDYFSYFELKRPNRQNITYDRRENYRLAQI